MKRALILAAAVAALTSQAQARDYISILGSSTVYPFAAVVAEQFGKTSRFKTPKIEATGSGGGIKLFCAGVGVRHPDIVNASRRIKRSEVEQCTGNGVREMIEVKVGYDGIVLANSGKARPLELSREQIFLALAKEVPDPNGGERLIANPYVAWSDIDESLPEVGIEVLGPPPTSGTRDAFVELALEGGCRTFGWIKAMKTTDKQRYKAICHTVREDGAYIEAGENDNLIVQKLHANPAAFGVFGYNFLDQNSDKIQGAAIDGIAPTFENIADQSYPISRPLYFYVKKMHIGAIPGIKEYLDEFTSEKAWGFDGYLADKGMIPMPDAERRMFNIDAENLSILNLISAL